MNDLKSSRYRQYQIFTRKMVAGGRLELPFWGYEPQGLTCHPYLATLYKYSAIHSKSNNPQNKAC